MGMMIIRHRVRDYGQWRPIFDAHAEMQKAAGLSLGRLVGDWGALYSAIPQAWLHPRVQAGAQNSYSLSHRRPGGRGRCSINPSGLRLGGLCCFIQK